MHLWRLLIALAVFAAFAASAAVVYRWTDQDGVVHYSDQAVPGAEKIVTSSTSANGIGGATRRNSSTGPLSNTMSTGLDYTVFAIDSPAPEQVFFNDDIVPVRLHVEPGLKPNQTVTWQLNGRTLDKESPTALSITLQSLARGAYTVAATVTDTQSGQSKTTEGVTFYVRQPSELSPQHKHP